MFPEYERFWAAVLDDPAAASEMLGRDPYQRERTYARIAAETPHLVLSTTLTETTWPTARIVGGVDELRTFRQEPGKAIYVVGGPRLVASLIDAHVLDELHLIVHPVLAGGGTSVYSGITQRDDASFLKHSYAYRTHKGAPRIGWGDVVITRSQPGLRVYGGAAAPEAAHA